MSEPANGQPYNIHHLGYEFTRLITIATRMGFELAVIDNDLLLLEREAATAFLEDVRLSEFEEKIGRGIKVVNLGRLRIVVQVPKGDDEA